MNIRGQCMELICLALLAVSTSLHAQLHNNPVNISEELPSPFVTDIDQDSFGFMWISTYEGLCKFDGTRITTFQSVRPAFSNFHSTHVNESYYDHSRRCLWTGTESGLARLDLSLHQWSPISINTPSRGTSNNVSSLEMDKDGVLWFSIDGVGIGAIDSNDSLSIFPFPEDILLLDPVNIGTVRDITIDPTSPELLWIASGGIFRFNMALHQFHFNRLAHPLLVKELRYNQIRSVYAHTNDTLYLGTWSQGLVALAKPDPVNNMSIIGPSKYQQLTDRGIIPPIYQEDQQTIWLTSDMGTCKFDLEDHVMVSCFNTHNQVGRNYASVIELKDNRNRYWTSSEYGVNIFDPLNNQIQNYTFSPGPEKYYYVDGIAYEHTNGATILTTYEGCQGVYAFDRSSGTVELISADNFLSDEDEVFYGESILGFKGGTTLVLERDGLYTVDLTQHKLEKTKSRLDDLDEIWKSAILHSDGTIWLGSSRSGIYRYDPVTDSLTTYLSELKDDAIVNPGAISKLYEDSRGNIWIKKTSGYSVFDYAQQVFINQPFWGNSTFEVAAFAEGDNNSMYMTIPGIGLVMASMADDYGLTKIIEPQHNLWNRQISSLAFDDNFIAWMLTTSGFQSYNPVNGETRYFSDADGITTFDPNFNRNPMILTSLYQLSDGSMAYVPRAGLSTFKPAEIKVNREIPKIYLYSITLPDSTHVVQDLDKVKLSYNTNPIIFTLSALAFTHSDKLQYQYKIEDISNDWTVAPEGKIVFNALNPGNYSILFRALNSQHLASEESSVILRISPPWWRSGWFYGASAFLLLAAIILLLKWRELQQRNIARRESEVRVLMANLESRALRAQMNPHFLFNIFNTIQELILTEDTDKAYGYTSKFSKLLRMILEYASKEEISIEEERDFLLLYLELESLRFEDAFEYSVLVEPGIDHQRLPVFMVQPLVENAIRHGLLPKSGNKSLSVEFSGEEDTILCSIRDNGLGISDQATALQEKDRTHAISLIRKRLQLSNKGTIDIQELNGQGVLAVLKFYQS